MTLAEKQQMLIDDYSIIEDQAERFAAIVDLGKKDPNFPEDERVDDNLVPGCTSRVWLFGEVDAENCVHLKIDAEAPGIKGVAVMMCQLYDGGNAAEVRKVEPEFITALRIDKNLTPTRLNGLRFIRERIKEISAQQ